MVDFGINRALCTIEVRKPCQQSAESVYLFQSFTIVCYYNNYNVFYLTKCHSYTNGTTVTPVRSYGLTLL